MNASFAGIAVAALLLHAAAGSVRAQSSIDVNTQIGINSANAAIAANAARKTQAPSFEGTQLVDWTDPTVGTTSRFTGCGGILVELMLATKGMINVLNVTISNQGDTIVHLVEGTQARFSNGHVRRMRDEGGAVMLTPQTWVQFVLEFPDKTDFEGATSLTIEMTFQRQDGARCTVPTRFQRHAPAELASYLPFTSFDFEFGGGARLLASGGPGRLGARLRPLVFFAIAFYPAVRHGFRLELDGGSLSVAHARDNTSSERIARAKGMSTTGYFLSYSARFFPASWLVATYSLGAGVSNFSLTDPEDTPENDSTLSRLAFTPRQQLRLSLNLGGNSFAHYQLGLSATHHYIIGGEFAGVDLDGHMLGAMLHLTFAD